MPDHIHLLIWPPDVQVVTDFMRDFKRFTSGRLTRQARLEGTADWVEKFEQAGQETGRTDYKVGQDSFWEQNIYTEKFLDQKLNYTHLHPVHAGLCTGAAGYPYPSCRNCYCGDNQLIEIDTEWR